MQQLKRKHPKYFFPLAIFKISATECQKTKNISIRIFLKMSLAVLPNKIFCLDINKRSFSIDQEIFKINDDLVQCMKHCVKAETPC